MIAIKRFVFTRSNSISQLVSHSINQSINRSFNQAINQSINQSISRAYHSSGFAPNLFANRVCVISGGNGGIGSECGRLIASLGGRVALLSRSQERADTISQSINQSINQSTNQSTNQSSNQSTDQSTLGECRGYVCDVTDEQSINQSIKQIRADFGEINVLICSHGISVDAIMASSSISQSINQSINVNLVGSLQLARAVHRSMMRSIPSQSINQSINQSSVDSTSQSVNQSISQSFVPQTNSIVFVSSLIASRGNVGQVAYAASKAGLTGAVKSLSKEWFTRHSIRVNSVEPGLVDTEMLEEKQRERFLKDQAVNFRIAKPIEIANVCAFISSDLASYITGTTIEVAGGMR